MKQHTYHKTKDQTPFWSLSFFDDTPPSYILGTMHVKDKRAFNYYDLALSKIDEVDAFFAEINFAELNNVQMNDAQLLPNGATLQSLIGERKYLKYKKITAKYFSVNLDIYNRYLPIITMNALMTNHLSHEYAEPLDYSLFNYASQNGKELNGLEASGKHINILRSIDLKIQLKQLKDLLSMPNKAKVTADKLANLYADGRINTLYKSTKKSMGKLRKPLIYDRNKEMANVIFENLKQPSFYAMGAGHLCGEKGILRLLKKKGVSLEGIKIDE